MKWNDEVEMKNEKKYKCIVYSCWAKKLAAYSYLEEING